jgi:citrate lyase subunit beta/citryl-CoA lyase
VTARSYLFVPGDNERKIEKAFGSAADALILDLEDSVLPERTAFARGLIQRTLKNSVSRRVPELWVRINALSTRNASADIDAVVCAGLHGVLIFAVVPETPQALFTLGGYAGASPRLSTMSWGVEDLSVALGASTNRDANGELSFTYRVARSLCLVAAKAAGAAAVETLWPDFHDAAGLQKCAVAARQEGFTGMIAIHPDQVPVINAAFTPGDEEIAHARRVVDAFAAKPGAGTVGLDGRMLDALHLKRAEAVLKSALASSKRPNDS